MAASPSIFAQDASVGVSINASTSGGWAALPAVDQLVAPVALYPDPLLGLVLPAATAPDDLQAAASGNGSSSDPAVQGLTHYPDVLNWMASNQDWSQQLGAAFADQPNQVMDAVQDLRRRAVAAGTLQSNDQIDVIKGNGIIQIIPRQADVVYVPRYDAGAVYFNGETSASITWGAALAAGAWLTFYPAWDRHALYTGDWYNYSRGHGGWDKAAAAHGGFFSGGAAGVPGAKEWRVSSDAQIRKGDFRSGGHGHNVRPDAMSGSVGASLKGNQRGNVGYQNTGPDRDRNREQQHRSTFAGDEFQRNTPTTDAQQRSIEANRDAGANRAPDENVNRSEMNANRDRQSESQMRAQDNRKEQATKEPSSGSGDPYRTDEANRNQNRETGQQKNRATTDERGNPDRNSSQTNRPMNTMPNQNKESNRNAEQRPNKERAPNEQGPTEHSPSASAPSS
jgi:hypothetical protein